LSHFYLAENLTDVADLLR